MTFNNDRAIIGIDASNILNGGGRTHLIELLSAANPTHDQFSVIYVWGAKETLSKLPDHDWLKKQMVSELDKGLIHRLIWQKYTLGKIARKIGCTVLFVPGGSYSADFRPIVTMSQNMLPFEWRELIRYGFSLMTIRLILLRFLQTRSFRLADGVIFLTDYSKQKVLAVTGKLSGQTCVIPHGLHPRFLVSKSKGLVSSTRYPNDGLRLIYVSIVDQYKHQWNVVEAIAKARSKLGIDLKLDLIGPSYTASLSKLNNAINIHDPKGLWVKYHGVVDYEALHNFYAQAQIGIFASSCENMPIILLETMAASIPVLSSNRGPMPEVLGDAGMYFDPEIPDTLCDALCELLNSEDKMLYLSNMANEKARSYSWERCSIETFRFLRSVSLRHTNLLGKNACVE